MKEEDKLKKGEWLIMLKGEWLCPVGNTQEYDTELVPKSMLCYPFRELSKMRMANYVDL